jgi:PhnB protein
MKLYTQLNFGGDCEEAFRYYEKHLGGKITVMMKQADGPEGARRNVDEAVMHARLDLGDVELIANDVPVEKFKPIRSSYLYLQADSTEHADKLWAALAVGGQITWPIGEQFFATRFGQLRDRFGVLWSVIHPKEMPAG